MKQEVPMDAYCVACKEKTLMMSGYKIKVSDSGRRMAQGVCSKCEVTKVNRILGKQEAYYAQSPNHPVFYGKTEPEPTLIKKRIKVIPDVGSRRGRWWEVHEYKDGEWRSITSGYSFSERGMKSDIKRKLKLRERTVHYLDLNFNRI